MKKKKQGKNLRLFGEYETSQARGNQSEKSKVKIISWNKTHEKKGKSKIIENINA